MPVTAPDFIPDTEWPKSQDAPEFIPDAQWPGAEHAAPDFIPDAEWNATAKPASKPPAMMDELQLLQQLGGVSSGDIKNMAAKTDADHQKVSQQADDIIRKGLAMEGDTYGNPAFELARERVMQTAREHAKANPAGIENAPLARGMSALTSGAIDRITGRADSSGRAYDEGEQQRRQMDAAIQAAYAEQDPYGGAISGAVGKMLAPESVATMAAAGGAPYASPVANVGKGVIAFTAQQTGEQGMRGETMTPGKNLVGNAAMLGVGELAGVAGNALGGGLKTIAGKAIGGAAGMAGVTAAQAKLEGRDASGPELAAAAITGLAPIPHELAGKYAEHVRAAENNGKTTEEAHAIANELTKETPAAQPTPAVPRPAAAPAEAVSGAIPLRPSPYDRQPNPPEPSPYLLPPQRPAPSPYEGAPKAPEAARPPIEAWNTPGAEPQPRPKFPQPPTAPKVANFGEPVSTNAPEEISRQLKPIKAESEASRAVSERSAEKIPVEESSKGGEGIRQQNTQEQKTPLQVPQGEGRGPAKPASENAVKSLGPGAAGESDPAFKAETGGNSVTPENAPKVLRTLSPEANAVRQTQAASNVALGKTPKNATSKVRDAYNAVADAVRRYAQQTFPSINRADTNAGDAAARLISSREVIKHQANELQSRVMDTIGAKPGDAMDRKLGAVLVEDQLRGIREKFAWEAKRLRSTSDSMAEINKAEDAVKAVKTIIGAPDSPFKTKADYEAALNDPAIQSALAAHRQFVEPVTEENYRLSAQIDPETLIATRGQDTNSHISLKAIREEAEPAFTQKGLKSGGNVANTLRKHSPFEREAKGNAEQYELNYSELVKNSIERGTLPASQARFYNSLVDGGVAILGKPGQKPTIDGKPTVALDLEYKPNEKLYVRSDIAGEVRNALKIDKPENPLTLVSDVINQITLMSGIEGISHGANHLAVLYKSPLAAEHVPAWLDKVPAVGKMASILDAVGTNSFKLLTGDIRANAALTELAKLGALKPEYEGFAGGKHTLLSPLTSPIEKAGAKLGKSPSRPVRIAGKVLENIDPIKLMGKTIDHLATAARLSLNDGFQKGVDAGIIKDTTQNRRDYINQVGQYHKEAQAGLVRVFRNIGLGPFATAGSTFYSQAVRGLGASPGYKATSGINAAKARLHVVASIGGTLAMIAAYNYLRTGKIQPPGTPWGSLYLKDNDKGQPEFLDIADIIGAKRSTRTIGLDAAIEGSRNNLTATATADKAIRQAEGAAISPFAGPVPTAAMVALTGYTPHGLYDEAGRAKKGESQQLKNLKAAAQDLNPSVGMALEGHERGQTAAQQIAQQFGKFGPRTGKNAEELRNAARPQRVIETVAKIRRGGKDEENAYQELDDEVSAGKTSVAEMRDIITKGKYVDDDAYGFVNADPSVMTKRLESMSPTNRRRPIYRDDPSNYSYLNHAEDSIDKSPSLSETERKALKARIDKLKTDKR